MTKFEKESLVKLINMFATEIEENGIDFDFNIDSDIQREITETIKRATFYINISK